MVKNKKGLMRIVEATIAILIILGVILVVSSRREVVGPQQDYNEIMRKILDEVARNDGLRGKILEDTDDNNEDTTEDLTAEYAVENKVKEKINYLTVGYRAVICDLNQADCGIAEYPEDAEGQIYLQERIISSNFNVVDAKPKVVKLYLWRKKS